MQSDKYQGLVRLIDGDEPKEIAGELGIAYATVLRWKRELRTAQEEDKVTSLVAASYDAIDDLAAGVLADVPDEALPAVTTAVEGVISSVTGLKRLETELQGTAVLINNRIRFMTSSANSVGDIVELTNAVAKLQDAFFGKGTTVNVQQNVEGDAYSSFLGDAPGAA